MIRVKLGRVCALFKHLKNLLVIRMFGLHHPQEISGHPGRHHLQEEAEPEVVLSLSLSEVREKIQLARLLVQPEGAPLNKDLIPMLLRDLQRAPKHLELLTRELKAKLNVVVVLVEQA